MSAVWRAVDDAHHRWVAVKLVPLDVAPNFDLQTLSRLDRVSAQPGLVTLLDHGREGPWWYQIAEWIDGETLDAWWSRCAAHAEDARAAFPGLMREIATALTAYHRAGFVHGDVKASNVLVSQGHACVIDLVGLPIGARWNRTSGLTPAFASPESRGGAPASPRDDIHSFAAMVLHLAGDRPPDLNEAALLTAPQWRLLQDALDPARRQRFESVAALANEVWGAWPEALERPATPTPLPPPDLIAMHRDSTPHTGNIPVARWGMAAAVVVAAVLVAGRQTGKMEWAALPAALPVALPVTLPPVGSERGAPERTALPSESPDASQSQELSTAASITRFLKAKLRGAGSRSDVDRAEDPDAAATLARTITPPPPIPVELEDVELPSTLTAMPAHVGLAPEDVRRALAAHPRPEPVPVRAVAFFPDRSRRTHSADAREPVEVPKTAEARAPVTAERVSFTSAPARAELPMVTERPVVTVVPDRPQVVVVPERPDKPERPEVVAVIERPVIPVIERPDRPDKPERPDKPDKPDRPDVVAVIERPVIPVIERPDRPDKPERPDKPDKPDRPDKPNRPDRPDRPEKPGRG